MLDLSKVDIKVVNTHLFGGRYDDWYWKQVSGMRIKQIKHIVKCGRPTILMGDFNADSKMSKNIIKKSYWQNLLNGKGEEEIIEYNVDLHKYLIKEKFTSIIKRNDLKYNSTSDFGTIIDWIYIDKECNYKVKEFGKIEGIDLELSDHDFPWVRIEIKV